MLVEERHQTVGTVGRQLVLTDKDEEVLSPQAARVTEVKPRSLSGKGVTKSLATGLVEER